LFALIVLSVCCQADEIGTTSFFAQPIYKIEEKVGVLDSRLKELEDVQRHVLDKLDQAAVDEKKAIRDIDKQKIVQVMKWLRTKVAMVEKDKKQIFETMKKLLTLLPVEERLNVLRRLRIEYRFDSVKEMIQDARRESGFTEQQIEEFHNYQIKRAKIDKKRADAKRKLALAMIEKRKAEKKAKEAVKLAKAQAKEKKVVKEVKKAIEETKKEEKKSDKVLDKLVKKAKKQTKKNNENIKKLQGSIQKYNGKVVNKAEKAKIKKVQKEIKAVQEKQQKNKKDNSKKVEEEMKKKITAQQNLVEKISLELEE